MEALNIKPGDKFTFKGYEWIVLDDNVDGGVMCIMLSKWSNEAHCFDNDGRNNYAKSSLRRKLLNELLPVLGEDNLIPHEVDMVADNGDDRYGTVTDRVFILSCDEYRKYRKHVPLLPEWMWTCTPWYISDAGNGDYVCYVHGAGYLYRYYAYVSYGVAPVCVFKREVIYGTITVDEREKEISSSEWIPVEKKLPKSGQIVLCSYRNSDVVLPNRYIVRNNIGLFVELDYQGRSLTSKGVTAWMPWPEPYREENTDNE